MRPDMIESLTPVPIEEVFAGLCDKTNAAWQLGHELMQPMPPGWLKSMYELSNGLYEVAAVATKAPAEWSRRTTYENKVAAVTLTEAHRLCREQAWAKHRKNTGGT